MIINSFFFLLIEFQILHSNLIGPRIAIYFQKAYLKCYEYRTLIFDNCDRYNIYVLNNLFLNINLHLEQVINIYQLTYIWTIN